MATHIFPGEHLSYTCEDGSTLQRHETGLMCQKNEYIATRMGRLVMLGKRPFVKTFSRKYWPVVGDAVIGQIMVRHAEGYKVDLGGQRPAQLAALAFEHATRKNRPNLQVGALVYARVSEADKDMEPDIECLDAAQGFGELKGGYLIRGLLPCFCKTILEPNHPLLSTLGAAIPFEVAIGLNGRLWIHSAHVGITIVLARIIQMCQGLNNEQIVHICHQAIKEAQQWLQK